MYDYVFITHLPSFYKSNLYEKLAEKKRIKVIYISNGSSIRNQDFVSVSDKFDYEILNQGAFENRRLLSSIRKLLKSLHSLKFNKLVVGGWDLPEFWLSVLLTPSRHNAVVVESSIFECKTQGIKGLIKKIFMTQVGTAYCSGMPHERLVRELGFKAETVITRGVGLMNPVAGQKRLASKPYTGKYIYVGRLSEEKGLLELIRFVNKRSDLILTIVGEGPQEDELKALAGTNIKFLGYVNNTELGALLVEHDVFVLPSFSEPWGLVIEEAIGYGLPVLCSSCVGASEDLVLRHQVGITYDVHSELSFKEATECMQLRYRKIAHRVSELDFNQVNQEQVDSYV